MPSFVSAWDHNNDKVIRILVESVVTKKGAERSERGGHGAERVERHPQGGAHHGASCCSVGEEVTAAASSMDDSRATGGERRSKRQRLARKK